MKVLDIGCGSGFYQKDKLVKFRGSVNVDILKPQKYIPNFVLGDSHLLPFKKDSFDKVYMVDLIEHLENPSKALKESFRVLKNHGYIFLITPNCMNIWKVLRVFKSGFYSPHKEHIATYGIPELKQLLNRIGFKKYKIDTVNFKGVKYFPFYVRFIIKLLKNMDEHLIVKVFK